MANPAFRPNSGRQQRITGYADIFFDQLVSGTPLKAFWLPPGAIDITGHVKPIVAFDSATSDVLDVGNVSVGNAYKNDGNIAALTDIALAALPDESTGFWVYVTWVGDGTAPTTGQVRLILEYAMKDRAQFDHGENR